VTEQLAAEFGVHCDRWSAELRDSDEEWNQVAEDSRAEEDIVAPSAGDYVPHQRRHVIDAVERALRALQVFSAEHPTLTLSECAALIGLSRGTTRRILITFEDLGFISHSGRQFFLTPRVLQLGYGYLASLPFWDHAQPHMRDLADAVQESCSVATLDGEDIVYVARVPSRRHPALTLSVGSRLPAYATSMGHVLLAGLSDPELRHYIETADLKALTSRTIIDRDKLLAELLKVRRQGYSINDQEREMGVRSVAAPIKDRTGRVIAALNASTNAARTPLKILRDEITPKVKRAAEIISDELAYL
jgi:IclR family pca regulon transcriptional regulator